MSWPTGTPLLADKSAWTRAHRCAAAWTTALSEDRIVICEIVRLELLFSGRSAADVQALDRNLGTRRDLAITRGTLISARRAMLDLAEPGFRSW